MTQRFLVTAPRIPLKWIAVVMFVVVVTYVSAMLAVHTGRSYDAARNPSLYINIVAVIFVGIVLAVGFLPRKIPVDVAYGRLTVNEYRTAVFPLASARLGMWMTPYYGTVQGTALHLREGSKSYIIGGQDHRVESEWHVDAPVVQRVNAYMPAAQFAALLAVVFGDRLDAAGDRGQHAVCRCLLVENRTTKLPTLRNPQPTVAIEIDDHEIRVIDVLTQMRTVTAPLSQVTATPAAHTYRGRPTYTMPLLVVQLPGAQSIRIGIPDFRFSWRGTVPSHKMANYIVGGADWQTLVAKFNLTSYLNTKPY